MPIMPIVHGNRKILTVLVNAETKWEPGWTSTSFAVIGGRTRLVMANTSTGDVHVRTVNSASLLGGIHDGRKDWSAGWTTVDYFSVDGTPYLFILKESDGRSQVRAVADDGNIGVERHSRNLGAGWTTAEFYTIGGATYLLLLKESDGSAQVIRMNDDGSLGTTVADHDWTSGWTTATSYVVGSTPYLFLLKESSGTVHIHELNSDGSIGSRVETHDWTNGWTTAKTFQSGGKTFLFLLKKSTGQVHIHEMKPGGGVGREVERHDWTAGWSTVDIYRANGRNNLFLLKESTGDGHLHRMNNDGSVGERLDPEEPTPKSAYQRLMIAAGRGQDLLYDYIADQSEGRVSIDGSVVTGWHTYPGSWQMMKDRSRNAKIRLGIKVAEDAGYDVDAFDHHVVFMHDGPDSGAAALGVLGHPARESLEFVSHEVFHDFGLGHSFSDDPNAPGNADWEKVGEYDDPYDIMSALRSTGYGGVEFSQRGPNLNAFGRAWMGWLGDNVVRLRTDDLHGRLRKVHLDPLHLHGRRSARVLRLYARSGEYHSIEYRTSAGWDRALETRPLVHLVGASRYLGSEVDRRNWSAGWTSVSFFRCGYESFALMMKSGSGDVVTLSMTDHGRAGPEVDRRQWSAGWTTAKTYRPSGRADRTFLFLLKESTGEVHIHRMNPDGTIGPEIERRHWSGGWTTVEFFDVGDVTYLFLLKESTGEVHIHRMNPDGTIGPEIERRHWSGGWTTAQFYYIDDQPHLLLLKESTGDVHVHRMAADGDVGPEIQRQVWEPGWAQARFSGTQRLPVFFTANPDGRIDGEPKTLVRFRAVAADGTIGDVIRSHDWTAGWTNLEPFTTGLGTFLFGLKTSTGTMFSTLMCKSFLRRHGDMTSRPPIADFVTDGIEVTVTHNGSQAEVVIDGR